MPETSTLLVVLLSVREPEESTPVAAKVHRLGIVGLFDWSPARTVPLVVPKRIPMSACVGRVPFWTTVKPVVRKFSRSASVTTVVASPFLTYLTASTLATGTHVEVLACQASVLPSAGVGALTS